MARLQDNAGPRADWSAEYLMAAAGREDIVVQAASLTAQRGGLGPASSFGEYIGRWLPQADGSDAHRGGEEMAFDTGGFFEETRSGPPWGG